MKKTDAAMLSDLINRYGLPHVLKTLSTLCDTRVASLKSHDAEPRVVKLWQRAGHNLYNASLDAEFNG